MEKLKIYLAVLLVLIGSGAVLYKTIKNDEKNDEKSNYISISFNELKEKIDKKEKFVLVITQEGCSHCKNYKPIVEKVTKKYNIKIYDLDLTKLTDDEAKELITIANVSGTPTTVFFENGEETSTLNRLNGSVSESTLIKKLKKLNYIGD